MAVDTDDYVKLNALRVEALYDHSIIPVAVMLCSASILTAILWNTGNKLQLLAWLLCLLAVTFIRYIGVFKFRTSDKNPEEYIFWLNLYFYGAVLSGIIWGSAAYVFIIENNIIDIILLTMLLTVTAAGSIGIYSIFQRVYYGFNLPALIPLVVFLLSRDHELVNMLGAIAVVFVGFIFVIQYDAHKVINQLLLIKLDNRFLLDNYERDQKRIKKLEVINRNREEEVKKIRVELEISRNIIETLRKQLNR